MLKEKFGKKSQKYLSFLIEKSFKHSRFAVAKFLIESGVHIRYYEDIFKNILENLMSESNKGMSG